MSSSRSLLLAALALAATLTACDKLRPLANDGSGTGRCTACHGYPPPPGAPGSAADASAHPNDTNCHACHPGTVDANGNIIPASAGGLHENGKIDVMGGHPSGFADPAVHGPAAIADLASCQACHGTDFAGGVVGVSCTACHATPTTAAPSGFPDWQTNCTFCHGTRTASYAGGTNPVTAAPPVDVSGETATTALGVGAHRRHLAGGTVASAVACSACHVVPGDLTHVKGQPAAIKFSSFAGASAAWDRATPKCSNVYCHGATLSGGTATSPIWTTVDGTQLTCSSCHGAPPPTAAHATVTALTQCAGCHPDTVDAAGKILIAGGKHLNGVIDGPHPANWATPSVHGYQAEADLASCTSCHGADYSGGTSGVSCNDCHAATLAGDWKTNCTFCHGTQTANYTAANLLSAAPPQGVQGQTAATDIHVGAHQRHLTASTYVATAITCDTCHVVPTDLSHLDGVAQVSFSGIAASGSFGGTGTCTVYCHGATLPTGSGGGGTNETPSWTQTGVACTWCHSNNPTTGQHQRHLGFGYTCATCHGTGYSATAVVKATHVNGTVDKVPTLKWTVTSGQGSCTPACHGQANW